jgi:hypothetical protein
MIKKLIAFFYLTSVITIIFLHYPFTGYSNTSYFEPPLADHRWLPEGKGCPSELRMKWHSMRQCLFSGSMAPESCKSLTTEQVAAVRVAEKVLRESCTELVELKPARSGSNPFWEWISEGAFTHRLATGKDLSVAILTLSAIAGVAFVLFGRNQR